MPPRKTRTARAASQDSRASTEPSASARGAGSATSASPPPPPQQATSSASQRTRGSQPPPAAAEAAAVAQESETSLPDPRPNASRFQALQESARSERNTAPGVAEDTQIDELDEDGHGRVAGPSLFTARNEANHVKIMLATDNHVGYMERDPVRGLDSINSFREILKLAVEKDVDFILLGGDLFHENKPSRSTLHQVMASLRQYCLSDRPVTMELLSDPNDGRAEGYDFPAINYEDPNLNVGIPVFSIHGNHDDPQGVGAEGALSALDVLSVSGLVNYFGKVELPTDDDVASKASKKAPHAGGLSDVGIRIRPVLLQKGTTKIALYGMGNIKDERMHYELRSNRVRMYRPKESQDDWFNILCIHQNRAAHNPKACVPETMFDDSVHLVVWGHEHEQRIRPQAVGGKQYHITQPGSSVATSLSPGEAAEKMVAIIHVENTDYYLEEIPLQTVRPFIMDDMVLKDEAEDANVDLNDKGAVQKLLRDRVTELIDRAKEEWETKFENVPADQRPPGENGGMMLPLVRLRVEYEADIQLGNVIRFGQEFVDRVANPRDVLHFSKKKKTASRAEREAARIAREGHDGRYAQVSLTDIMAGERDEDDDEGDPDRLAKVKVGNLVKQALRGQNLELLNPDGLERAITSYVDKDDRAAITEFVGGMVKSYQAQLNSSVPDEVELEKELDRIRDEAYRNRRGGSEDGEDEDGDEDMEEDTPAPSRRSAAASGSRGRSAAASSSKAAQKKTSSKATSSRRRDDDSFDEQDDDSMMDGDSHGGGGGFSDYEEESAPAKSRGGGGGGRKAAAPAASSSRRGASTTTGKRAAASKAKEMFRGDDDDDDDDSDVDMASAGGGEGDSDFEDDDDEDDRQPARRGGAATTSSKRNTAASTSKTPARGSQTTRADVLSRATPASKKKTPAAGASKAKAGGSGGGRGGRAAAAADRGSESDGFEVDEEASQAAANSKGTRRR